MSIYKVWYSNNYLPNNWMDFVPQEEKSSAVYIGPKNASNFVDNWTDVLKNSPLTFPFSSLSMSTTDYITYIFWTKVARIYTSTPYNLTDDYEGFYDTSNTQSSYTSMDGSQYNGMVNINENSTQNSQYIWPKLSSNISNKETIYNWGYIYNYISSNNKLPITLENQLIKIPFGMSGPDYSKIFSGINEIDPQLLDETYLVGQTGPLQIINPVKFEDGKDLNFHVLNNGSAYQEAKSFYTYIPVNNSDDSKATDFDYNKFTFNQLVPKNYVDQLYNNIVGEGSVEAVTTLKKFQDILAGNTGIFTDIKSLTKGAIRSDAGYYTVQKINSALEIANSLSVNNSLKVVGSSFSVGQLLRTSWDELSVSQNVDITGTIKTGGSATFNNKVDIIGTTTLGQTGQTGQLGLLVNGSSVFMGDITYFGKLSLGNDDITQDLKTTLSGNTITTENLDSSRMTIGKQTRKSQSSVLTIDQLNETTTNLLDIKSSGTASVKIDKDGAIKITSNVSKVQLANKEVDSGIFYINDKWCIVTDDTNSLSFHFRKNPSDDWKCGVKFKTV
jgi:hypothetical protein